MGTGSGTPTPFDLLPDADAVFREDGELVVQRGEQEARLPIPGVQVEMFAVRELVLLFERPEPVAHEVGQRIMDLSLAEFDKPGWAPQGSQAHVRLYRTLIQAELLEAASRLLRVDWQGRDELLEELEDRDILPLTGADAESTRRFAFRLLGRRNPSDPKDQRNLSP